jgi:hypothetical protein
MSEPAPEAVPVEQRPSSNVAAPQEVVDEEQTVTVEEAASALLALIDEGHKIGDRALDAAREKLRSILGA